MPVPNIERRQDLLRRYSLSEGALASFENAGLLRPRSNWSGPLYSEAEDLRLRVILKAVALGFTLEEIARIVHAVR